MTLNKELARLRRLKLQNMDPSGRKQVTTTINNLERVADALKKAQAQNEEKLRGLTANFENERRSNAQLTAQIKEMSEQLKSAQDALRKAGEAGEERISKGIFSARIEEFQARLAEKEAMLRANERIREKLQTELDKRNEGATPVGTEEIFKSFAEDIEKAQSEIPETYEIADVQVELRGALGREGNKMVMGLDARRQVETDQATRVAFTLRRAARIKTVED